MKTKLITLIAAAGIAVAIPVAAAAAENGTCGESLTWTLDDSGIMTISGTGDMTDFDKLEEIPWYSLRNDITSLIVEDGVTNITHHAFNDCFYLKTVSIPDSVTEIGYAAFGKCTMLNTVKLGDGVKSLGDHAFYDCLYLHTFEFGNSLETISDYAFYGCESFKNISLPETVTSIGYMSFAYCPSIETFTIPDSVIEIGESAFRECKNLKSVKIGDGVTAIGASAFSDCENLTSVQLGKSVETIGASAFSDCTSLRGVVFPDSVKTIEKQAFRNCYIKAIAIGSGLTAINERAFSNCDSIDDIYYRGSEEKWNAVSINEDNTELDSADMHYNYKFYDYITASAPECSADSDVLTVNTKVTNKFGIEFNSKAIAVIYNAEGRVKNAVSQDYTLSRKQSTDISIAINDYTSENGDYVKLIIWNDINDLEPVTISQSTSI